MTGRFGALPAIYGTLLTSAIALVIAVPVSFGAAVFLVELAPSWIRTPGSFLIEMLAAIPSVIIGLWGLFVLVPFVRKPIEKWLGAALGAVPLFQGPPFGVGFLAAGIILSIMIIPIITAMSRDVIRAVPVSQRPSSSPKKFRNSNRLRCTAFAAPPAPSAVTTTISSHSIPAR